MPDINTYLTLGTGHVTAEVAGALTMIADSKVGIADDDWRYWVIAERWSDYGWWVWPNLDDGFDLLPQCLRDCFHFAVHHGCRWILFDCDGPAEPDLPIYDW